MAEPSPAVAAPRDRSVWASLARALQELLRLREDRRVSDPRTVH